MGSREVVKMDVGRVFEWDTAGGLTSMGGGGDNANRDVVVGDEAGEIKKLI